MVTLSRQQGSNVIARPRVEMLGVFGCGKTTLANKLASMRHELLAECPEMNPFWADGQAMAVAGPLAYELGFLVQHAHLASRAPAASPGGIGVCDWSLASDLLWASLRLGADLAVFSAVHREVSSRIGPPLGYIYLRQPEHVVASRLRARAIHVEKPLLSGIGAAVAQLDAFVQTIPPELVLLGSDDLDRDSLDARVRIWETTP